jgi:DNA-binding transcriptional ArsR family regulator
MQEGSNGPGDGVLRIHFTSEDMGRVRVAGAVDQLWEIANSVNRLRTRDGAMAFGAWRGQVTPRVPPAAGMLAPMLPPRGYFPDFLTPMHAGGGDLEPAIDAVLSTPRHRLRTDLTLLAEGKCQLPSWMSALAAGEPEVLHRLGTALRTYQRTALAPYAALLQARVDADRAARAQDVLTGGTDALLAGLGPVFRWLPPVLEADYPVPRELHLDGRGLLLQPSVFCWRAPVTLYDDALAPVLVYPVLHGPAAALPLVQPLCPAADTPLAALIGRTRAALLEAVTSGSSTGELGRRLGVSASTVSEHVGVLREAGLLCSTRRANRVLHTITPAGHAVLLAAQHAPPR